MKSDKNKDLAWVGDAVLALYTREWLMKEPRDPDFTRQERFTFFTSNAFLNNLAEPTAAEAEIGKVYQKKGLAAAFEYIETTMVPLYRKQLSNQRKRKRALN